MIKQVLVWLLILAGSVAYGQYNYYYGNLHSHSSYSDGNQDSASSLHTKPFQDFQYARQSQHMDFLGISDHNHSTAGMKMSNFISGVKEADSATVDNSFLALYGMEWGVISAGGHVLIYNFDKLINWENGNFEVYNSKYDYTKLFETVASDSDAFITFAHPNSSDYNNFFYSPFNATSNKVIVGSAIRSGPAYSTNTSYSNCSNTSYEDLFRTALEKGYRIGPTIDHDNHNTTFGRSCDSRLVVLAPALTRKDFSEAMLNRRFYASQDWNVEIDFRINGHVMGSFIDTVTQANIEISVNDNDLEQTNTITIYSGQVKSGQVATILTSTSGASTLTTSQNIIEGTLRYYYAVITQNDGDRIVTAPIWCNRGGNLAVNNENEGVGFSVYPNPTDGVINFEFDQSIPLSVELVIMDQLGRVLKVEHSSTAAAQHSYDLKPFGPGFYTVCLKTDGGNKFFKVVVE